MTDHVFHDLQHYMTVTVVIMALSLLVWVPMYLRICRNATVEDYVQDAIVLDPAHERVGTSAPGRQDISAQDTVFIMPDISHYTRFIAGGHFTDSCAQEIIFSLINAMISAGTKTVELSKLEGDAVLFYTDARKTPMWKLAKP